MKKIICLLVCAWLLPYSANCQLQLAVTEAVGATGTQVCVDMTATNFTNVMVLQYSINWNPAVLEYATTQNYTTLPGFSTASFNTSNAGMGIFTVSWNEPDFNGVTLAGTATLFQLCFNLIGMQGQNSDILVTGSPTIFEITNPAGAPINYTVQPGNIAINAGIGNLSVTDTLLQNVTCSGLYDGAIQLTLDGGQPPYAFLWSNGATTQNLSNITVGNYTVTITDDNGNSITESYNIIGEFQTPTAIINAGTAITCAQPIQLLSAAGSSTGTNITYSWTTPDGNIVSDANTLSPTINQGGMYVLMVVDNTSSCFAEDTITIAQDNTPPVAVATVNDTIDCQTTQLMLNGTGSSTGANMSYQWTALINGIVSGANTLQPIVNAGATYNLIVSNNTNGCKDTASVTVIQSADVPTAIANAVISNVLTCARTVVNLSGYNSSSGADYSYQWTTPDGNILTNPNTLEVEVNAKGSYIFTVRHFVTGCVNSDTILVDTNYTTPVATVTPMAQIGCQAPQVTLSATPQTNAFYVWATENGTIVAGEHSTAPLVSEAGLYQYIVTDFDTGCRDTAYVNVTGDTIPPIAQANAGGSLNCSSPTTTLMYNGTTGSAPLGFLWSTTDGSIMGTSSGVQITAAAAGTYQLIVINTLTQCADTTTVQLFSDIAYPIADAGDDVGIACGETAALLDGSNSAQGAAINYSWSSVGGAILTGVASTMPSVSGAGIYILTVLNTHNNCSASDTVVVSVAANLPAAAVGPDLDLCETEFMVQANLPTGATGQWTTNGVALFENANQPTTAVSNLAAGDNYLVWTLSAPDCPNYSRDTLKLSVAARPNAIDDSYVLNNANMTAPFNVTENDIFYNISSYSIAAITQPIDGVLAQIDLGNFVYTPPTNKYNGTDSYTYTVCNTTCPNLCDTATVNLRLAAFEQDSLNLPNAITPNGDGLNDTFVFDILYDNAQNFPDNELVVFNRWGDIVYQKQNYDNNWGGQNNAGNPLPEATYYYILRLDITKPLIYRGEVTIFR